MCMFRASSYCNTLTSRPHCTAAQIYKESSSWIDWGNSSSVSHMNLESLINYTSQIPFELCDGDGLGCAHVFSGAAIQVDALSSTCQHLTTAHDHQHPLLLRSVEFLRLGSPVTVLGQLSLQPYMASNDLQAVLRAPCSGKLAGCFIVHSGGRSAIAEALRHEAHAHLVKAAALVAGVALVAVSVGAWTLSSRQRRRAEGNGLGLGSEQQRRQQEAPRHDASASPTLHKCLICKARARDCLLLDCAHQVCCLECARGLASPASSSSPSAVPCSSLAGPSREEGPSRLSAGANPPGTGEGAGGIQRMGEEGHVGGGGGGVSGDVGVATNATAWPRPARTEVHAAVAAVAPRDDAQLPAGVAAQLRRLRDLIASASARAAAGGAPHATEHASLAGHLPVLGEALPAGQAAGGQAAWPACPECGARVWRVLRVYTS